MEQAPPTPSALREAIGISQSYASMILSESDNPDKRRTPPRSLAILIFRRIGWKHPSIAHLSDEDIDAAERLDGLWQPRREQAAA